LDTLLSLAFGVLFLLISLIVNLAFPAAQESMVVRVTLALAAAAVAVAIPGLFNLQWSPVRALRIKIAGGLIIFLIVLSVQPEPAQTAAAIEVTLLFLTPQILRHSFKKFGMRVSQLSWVLLSVLFIAGEAAFFSELAGGQVATLPSDGQVQTNIFAGADLKGEKQCNACYQHLWVRPEGDKIVIIDVYEPTQHKEAHVLLEVEWSKWERVPLLRRNYEGIVYYIVDEQCNAKLRDNAFKPGKIVLSWLIGFAEIPFLLDDNGVRRAIEKNCQTEISDLLYISVYGAS